MFEGLKNFQKANGLSVDEFMKPGGPTERKLNRLLGRVPRRGQGIIAKEASEWRPMIFAPVNEGRGAPERAPDLLQMAGQKNRHDDRPAPDQKPPLKVPPKPVEKPAGQKTDKKSEIPSGTKKTENPWPETPVAAEFRHQIHKKESRDENYDAKHPNDRAWGRYQMTPIALQDVGMMDTNEKWTGKYGVYNKDDFLGNQKAQEKVMADYMKRNREILEKNGALQFEGQKFNGVKAEIIVTESGLLAAAHRQGAPAVRNYLNHQKRNNWVSDPEGFPPKKKDQFLSIETRLREFQNITHKKP
ncbi:MAG: hypothetical protein HOO00_01005 [Rhodospirillaceae bacterium]|nr:hypothetical protein [Rhodospirillaceae bacterium]MBT5374752.1 hypothetical protein [Rhodospirillaceae bacterium]MBT5659448.1 hypothetical protein [Rhodospirillaceae bacterium]MBT5752174.1 hypothetical protein [Rhodospirillaceae bacterium]